MSQTRPSLTAETLAIARTIDTVLLESGDLHTVVLYGSAARGALRGGSEMASDVDVAVAGDEPLPIDRRLELASRLAGAVRRDVDLVDLRVAHGLLVKEILTTGRFLRKEHPDFVAEKMIEMYDYELFLAPQLREVRRERIARLLPEEAKREGDR